MNGEHSLQWCLELSQGRKPGDLHISTSQHDANTNGALAKAILAPGDSWLADRHDICLGDVVPISEVGYRMRVLPHCGKRPQAVEFGKVLPAYRGYANR